MKTILFLFFVLGCMQNLASQTDVKETLKKLNRDFLNSIAKKDTTTLSKILADDFIMINPAGARMTKKDNLNNAISPNIQFTSINIDSVSVTILTSDVGVVTCYTSFAFTSNGKAAHGKNCYQDIYLKRKSRWLAVAAHVTLFPAK